MAIQKKSLIGKQQSAKKALVAKRVSADAPKATQVKAPNTLALHSKAPFRLTPNRHNSTFRATHQRATFAPATTVTSKSRIV